MTMTWQQKFMALRAIAGLDTAIHARSETDWYVRMPYVEIGGNGFLSSPSSSGKTPELAVEQAWKDYAEVQPPLRCVIDAMGAKRREVRWNGFMWEGVAL